MINKSMKYGILQFTDEQREAITTQVLTADGKLEARVASYAGSEEYDVVQLWVGSSQDENDGKMVLPKFVVKQPGNELAVAFSRGDFEQLDGEKAWFGYRVNGGPLSALVGIPVMLTVPNPHA
ncbi:hypothetical protein IAE35_20850 [Pseudomonas sp. S75]|uniref:hypothetical protein n=1 Tax=unclassified Pseudomonas TaxID=196821 RepID=UPI00190859AA|nr:MULTISPECIES: hypothetical protein [unclassified Pseudomonas]MBJ9976274.1 hypothetical protein [Pseudomonas sp. S30]MBK0155795.1 hypothetical protein [Pseudomonas sp. S75]